MKITTYRANKFYGLPALLIPLLLMLPLLNSEVALESRILGFALFFVIALILILVPLGAKLEVGEDFVRTRLFGLHLLELHPSDIQVMTYEHLFRGGLGYGKGLNIRAIVNGRSRSTSIGERLYGKAAVAHAKRVLER